MQSVDQKIMKTSEYLVETSVKVVGLLPHMPCSGSLPHLLSYPNNTPGLYRTLYVQSSFPFLTHILIILSL